MTDKDIIVNLTRENQKLKKFLIKTRESANDIVSKIYCIGGPLNDNCKNYNVDQMRDFKYIVNIAQYIVEDGKFLLKELNKLDDDE